jgi:hypothetical protein
MKRKGKRKKKTKQRKKGVLLRGPCRLRPEGVRRGVTGPSTLGHSFADSGG